MKIKCDEPLSNVAFNFNLRRYSEEVGDFAVGGSATVSGLKLFGNVLTLHGGAVKVEPC